MYKQRIILFSSVIAIIFIFLLFLSYFFCIKHPLYLPAEYWLKEAFTIKEHYAQTITTPKIIVASGSNSLFSICSPVIKEKTNKQIVNFGLHADIPLEIYFALIKKFAKPNDIVLLPLEYSYYQKENEFNKWHIENLTTWGTEYIKEFTKIQQLKILIQSITTLSKRIYYFKGFTLPIRTYDTYMENKKTKALLSNQRDYSNSINFYGENLQDSETLLPKNYTFAYLKRDLLDFPFQQLKDFANFLKKQNIILIITYPVSLQNSHFDLTQKEYQNQQQQFTQKIKKYGLNMIGIPELSHYELPYSYDTGYHLNAEGAILRSLYLSDAINCYLAGTPQKIPDMEEYKKQKKAEAKQILEEYRKLGYFSE